MDICDPMDYSLQAPMSMWFSRQEYRSGCHFLLQGIFLTQRWNYLLLGSGFFTTELYMDIRDLFFFSFRDTNVLIFVTDETLSKGNKSYWNVIPKIDKISILLKTNISAYKNNVLTMFVDRHKSQMQALIISILILILFQNVHYIMIYHI